SINNSLFLSPIWNQIPKFDHKNHQSIFFFFNELAILEFIHFLVETMDRHFGNVCELDIMFHLEKVHFMLEEMVMNGYIIETSKSNVLAPYSLWIKLHNFH
ncbi:hypothetical protein MKX03_029349, partial [Papaver bracteatum]